MASTEDRHCTGRIPALSNPFFHASNDPVHFIRYRTLTFLHLPVLNFWLLLCPLRLSYDWQMGSIPLLTSLSDARCISIVVFYGCLTAFAYKIVRCVASSSSSSKSVKVFCSHPSHLKLKITRPLHSS